MTFQDIRLPLRPLTIKREPIAHGVRGLVIFVLLAALATALYIWQGPGLVRDYEISKNPVVIMDDSIIDGECTTRRGITDCEVHLVYDYEGKNYDTNVSFAFIDFHSGDYLVDLVVSGDNPALATLSLGLDMLWNRLAVFMVFFLLIAGGAITMLYKGIQILRSNAAMRHAGVLTLVPVDVVGNAKVRGGMMVSYIDKLKGPKSKRNTASKFGRDEAPLIVADATGAPVGVAVKHEQAALPVLLDAGLERLDLTLDERRALLATMGEPYAASDVVVAETKAKFRPLRAVLTFVAIILLIVVGVIGYWLWYVTSSPTQFESLGMEINNMLPEALNNWGCDQLQQRFGDDRAPFGCTAADYTSWK